MSDSKPVRFSIWGDDQYLPTVASMSRHAGAYIEDLRNEATTMNPLPPDIEPTATTVYRATWRTDNNYGVKVFANEGDAFSWLNKQKYQIDDDIAQRRIDSPFVAERVYDSWIETIDIAVERVHAS